MRSAGAPEGCRGAARASIVEVGSLSVMIENRQDLDRTLVPSQAVRSHGVEARRLACAIKELSVAELQAQRSAEDEPIAARVYPDLGKPGAHRRPKLW